MDYVHNFCFLQSLYGYNICFNNVFVVKEKQTSTIHCSAKVERGKSRRLAVNKELSLKYKHVLQLKLLFVLLLSYNSWQLSLWGQIKAFSVLWSVLFLLMPAHLGAAEMV